MSKTAAEPVDRGAAASAARPLRVRSTLPLQGRVATRVEFSCCEADSREAGQRRSKGADDWAYLNPAKRLSNEFDCSTGAAPDTSAVWVWADAEPVVVGVDRKSVV